MENSVKISEICKEIKKIDARVSAYADGDTICGTFRGKVHEDYCYNVKEKIFIFNNEGKNVRISVEKAIEAIEAIETVETVETIETVETNNNLMKITVNIKSKDEGLVLLKNVQKNCANGLAINHSYNNSSIVTDTVLATVKYVDTDNEGFCINPKWEFAISSNYWNKKTLKQFIENE